MHSACDDLRNQSRRSGGRFASARPTDARSCGCGESAPRRLEEQPPRVHAPRRDCFDVRLLNLGAYRHIASTVAAVLETRLLQVPATCGAVLISDHAAVSSGPTERDAVSSTLLAADRRIVVIREATDNVATKYCLNLSGNLS